MTSFVFRGRVLVSAVEKKLIHVSLSVDYMKIYYVYDWFIVFPE